MKKRSEWPKWCKWLLAAIGALIVLRMASAVALKGFYPDEIVRKQVVENYLAGKGIKPEHSTVAGVPTYVHADDDWSPWPTFYAPAIVWGKVFGTSNTSLRIFTEIGMTIAILIFASGFSLWFKDRRKAFLLFALIGLSVPWLWLQGAIFWNPTLVPLYFALAFWAFSKLTNRTPKSLRGQAALAALAVVGLILVAYTYKPPIVPAAILCLVMLGYWWAKKTLPRPVIIGLALGAGVLVIPFLMFYLGMSGANDRTTQLSIFSLPYGEAINKFWQHLMMLVSPVFLFIYGDLNPRHSVGGFGMLGVGLAIPVVYAIILFAKKRLNEQEVKLMKIMGLAILLAYIGVATTNEGMPHSLRAVSAALPWCAIATIGVMKVLESKNKKLRAWMIVLLAAGIVAYIIAYFFFYAPTSDRFFV